MELLERTESYAVFWWALAEEAACRSILSKGGRGGNGTELEEKSVARREGKGERERKRVDESRDTPQSPPLGGRGAIETYVHFLPQLNQSKDRHTHAPPIHTTSIYGQQKRLIALIRSQSPYLIKGHFEYRIDFHPAPPIGPIFSRIASLSLFSQVSTQFHKFYCVRGNVMSFVSRWY